MQQEARKSGGLRPVPETAHAPALQPLLERVRNLPPAVQPLVREALRRTLDDQDDAYAGRYRECIERTARLETRRPASGTHDLTQAVAR